MRKKKLLVLLVIVTIAVSGFLTGCGSSNGSKSKTTSSSKKQTTKKIDFDETKYTDTGSGTFALSNESGSTADGKNITVYAGNDDYLIQIEYDTEGVNGNALSYLYVDGMEKDKEQVSDAQVTFDLKGNDLKPGTHKVELVQFENDDPSGTVTMYKTASYDIKSE